MNMAHVTTSMLRRKNQSIAQLQSKDAAFKSILYLQRHPLVPKTGFRLPKLTRHHFLKLSAAITEHCASPTAEYWLHVIRCGNHQGRQPPSGRWLETSFEAVHVHFKDRSRRLTVFDCLQLYLGDHRGRKCGAENATVERFSDKFHHLDIAKYVIEIATSLHGGFITSSLWNLSYQLLL